MAARVLEVSWVWRNPAVFEKRSKASSSDRILIVSEMAAISSLRVLARSPQSVSDC